MNKNLVKVIGIAATVVSVIASLATNWVNDKNLDNKIAEKVTKALAEKE